MLKGDELIPLATLTAGRVYKDPDAAACAFRGGLPLLRPDVLKAQTIEAICDILDQVADNKRHSQRGALYAIVRDGQVVLVDFYGAQI